MNESMNDRDFLIWLHHRLTQVHGEQEFMDYMHQLRAIISATPGDQNTPCVTRYNKLGELITDLNLPPLVKEVL